MMISGNTTGGRGAWRRATAAVGLAVTLMVSSATWAAADDVFNNLDPTIDSTAEVMALNVGGSTKSTTLAVNPTNGDGKNGCNLTGSSTLTVSVGSSNPTVATVSPSSLTFDSCAATRMVTVTPLAVGSATVSLTQTSNTSGGTFNLAPATFTANVAPPANTAPSIAVSGVETGSAYSKGAVPAATCLVTDAEDGPSSFPATLSAVTGPDAADGLGSQTASCAYTDHGGLDVAASKTYSIVDLSAPVISHVLSPSTPDGGAGWYRSDVTLDWTVSDAQSPSSVQTTGCQDISVTADQAATDYSCSATSAGGSAGPAVVSIKRDSNAPVVSAGVATGTSGSNGWWTSDVSVPFTAVDGLSGPASQSQSVTSSGEGAAVVVSSPAFTDVAGNTRPAGDVTRSFKIDKSAPNAPLVSFDPEPNSAGWNRGPVTVSFSGQGDNGPSGVAGCSASVVVTAETSGQTVSGTCTDNAGIESAVSSVTVKLDGTAPVVTVTEVRGNLGDNGWYRSGVDVDFTATDVRSGLVGAATRTVSSSGEGAAVLVESPAFSDVAGNTAPVGAASTTVMIDSKAPHAPTVSLSTDPNAHGWHKAPVTVHFADAGDVGASGVASCTGDVTVVAETAAVGQTVSGTCVDNAGNESSATSVVIKLDMTKPTVSSTTQIVGGTEGEAGWYTSDVTVRFTAADGLSGPATESKDVTSSGQGAAVTVNSPVFTDQAGNSTTVGEVTRTVKVDKAAPSAPVVTVDPTPNADGWNNATVTVSFTPNGDTGGSGIASCTAPVTVADETAAQSVPGTCRDVAGNVSNTASANVKLDKNAPVVSAGVATGTSGSNGWWTSDVSVPFTAVDGLSGPASQSQSVTSSGEGAAVVVSSPAFTDVAGNTRPAGDVTRSFKIDKSAPINVAFAGGPSAGGRYYFGSVPSAPTCTADDLVSGLASCTVTGYGSTVGTYVLTATATDNAGRQATATRSYSVLTWDLRGYYSPVDMGGVLNTVKGGSTVPLKFEMFSGTTELTSTGDISNFTSQKISCSGLTGVEDAIEILSTGGTSLRYDSTGGQFIQNWKTPTGAGTCYAATVTARDGSAITAYFKLK